jgi:carbon monoxide dehydrogenase subunit G
MKVEGEHLFKAPRQVVYDMFNDPDVLGSAVPGNAKNGQDRRISL